MTSRAPFPGVEGRAFLGGTVARRQLFSGRANRDIPRANFFRAGCSPDAIGRRLCPADRANGQRRNEEEGPS